MVENRKRGTGQRSLPFLKGMEKESLKTDFSLAFCGKCRKLRSLLKCTSTDLEKCILMYYTDLGEFVARIIRPTMFAFCTEGCEHFKTGYCKPWEDNRVPLRCFLSAKTSTIEEKINVNFTKCASHLVVRSCQKDIYEIFAGTRIKTFSDIGFEKLANWVEGSIGKLTEEAVWGYLREAKKDIRSSANINIFDTTNAPGTYTQPKKKFFFKEKI